MERIRRHISYANVLATLALLFAMSGGALAARQYLITSPSQIKPSVLKKLKGAAGAHGSTGATGTAGAAGPQGPAGQRGERGEAGPVLPPSLPSGDSESGTFGLRDVGGTKGDTLEESASFPIPLAEGVSEAHIISTVVNKPVTHCAGPGQADPGFLCIYMNKAFAVETPTKEVLDPEISPAPAGTGRFGFVMAWTIEASNPGVSGTYTVTAG